MNIMPSRYHQLVESVQGLQQTGVPLVGLHDGRLYPAGFADDMGIHYFIPALVRLLGVSVDQAIDLFFAGIGLLAFLAGVSGLFLLYRQANQRVIACLIISAATGIAFLINDVYIVSFFIAIVSVPWILYAAAATDRRAPYTILPVIAFLIPLADTLRSHSGTTMAIFLIALLATGYITVAKKSLLILLMLVAASVPVLSINYLVHERNAYLRQQEPGVQDSDGKHPFWHSVYIGLGFLNNPYVGQYLDEVAIEKVRSVDPRAEFLSPQYDRILKQETIRIIREHPKFIVLNLAAKAGVILLFLVLSLNVGLPAALVWIKPWQIDLAFALGLLFSSLFGFLVMPYPNYLLGFIGLAVLYSIISINHGLQGSTARAFAKKLVSRYTLCAE